MKTNVVLQSKDRSLFGITIRQETKTGFFNMSDLQEAYTYARVQNGWMDKNITQILQGKENAERIYYLLKEQGFINIQLYSFIEEVNNNGIAKTLKKYGVYKTTGARHTKTTWCHDSIWILLSLELSPIFYAKTVIWLRDDLVRNRIEAGNFYKGLSAAVSKFKNVDYIMMAKALNYIVFNRHEAGIRNTGTVKQLKEMEDLEKKMAFAIDMGYINSFDRFIEELRKIYLTKWNALPPVA